MICAVDGERIGIELIVSVTVWLLATLVAFFFIGAVAGIIAILAGVALFGFWLARMIRQQPSGH
jgi:hypothetical protein